MIRILENINILLNMKQMSWYELSKLTGIPESSLWDYRHHRKKDITFSAAIKIAEALEISLDDLAYKDLSKK